MRVLVRQLAPCSWAPRVCDGGGPTVPNYFGHILRRTGRFLRSCIFRENSRQTCLSENVTYLPKSNAGRNVSAAVIENGIGRRLSRQVSQSTNKQSIVARLVSKWVSDSFAAELRRNTAKKLMFRGVGAVPSFAFVGVALRRNTDVTLVTEEEELETVCQEIRVVFGKLFGKPSVKSSRAGESLLENNDADVGKVTLKNLELGSALAKGCNAVVYSAKLKNTSSTVKRETDILQDKVDNAIQASGEVAGKFPSANAPHEQMAFPVGSIGDYDLAVKMMFNYDAESNANAIWQAMHKECLPARYQQQLGNNGPNIRRRSRKQRRLPAHPNIVEMYCAFADWVPSLPDAMLLYPDALPVRINQTGAGRNMTLFLVMKRYHCTLKEYLHHHQPTMHTSLLLLTQLLEGVSHLVRHGVAHRDLKTDNILVDLTHGISNPVVSITDFGCCLADETVGLRLPFPMEDIFRGGNMALMAPEVVSAEPGPFSYIDYSKADLWAVGTIAYELFGAPNPFYTGDRPQLNSGSYRVEDIPPLPNRVPKSIQLLVKKILDPHANHRPTPAVAASVCQLLLHVSAPQLFEFSVVKKQHKKVIQWLLTFAASTLCQQNSLVQGTKLSFLEHQLRVTFLKRVSLFDVMEALQYINLE